LKGEEVSKEDKVLRFMLPDLLGKPSGLTNSNGDMIFPSEFEIPPDSCVFFISVKEWQSYKTGA